MSGRRWAAVVDDGRLVAVLDEADDCRPREYGDQCGGCSRCCATQARHYGYTVREGLDDAALAALEAEVRA